MKTTAMMDPRKKASTAFVRAGGLARSERDSMLTPPAFETKSLDETIQERVAHPGFSYDFSQPAIHPPAPATDTHSSQAMTQSYQLSLASPRACPFSGTYHTCSERKQAKLVINGSGDEYEQEAERVADQAMRIKRVPLQSPTTSQVETTSVPPIVHEVLRSPGQPLDLATRAFMESCFGHNFSQVRVYTGRQAGESAKMLQTYAYTLGNNAVFGQGQYRPETLEGRQLLAHELTHVVQRRSVPMNLNISSHGSSEEGIAENEAERIANQVVSTQNPSRVSVNEDASRVPILYQKKKSWWQRFKEWIGVEPDEEKLLQDLNKGLQRSQRLCEIASMVTDDPEAAKRLSSASEKLGSISKSLSKALSVRSAARDIVKFVDAVEELNRIDVGKEPEKAAAAFGKLFSSVGSLGKRLPEGPWTAYFDWLAASADFFTNMQRKLRPELRWKRQFEEIEK